MARGSRKTMALPWDSAYSRWGVSSSRGFVRDEPEVNRYPFMKVLMSPAEINYPEGSCAFPINQELGCKR